MWSLKPLGWGCVAPAPLSLPSCPVLLISKRPPRDAEDEQDGKWKAKQDDQQSKGTSKEISWHLSKLSSYLLFPSVLSLSFTFILFLLFQSFPKLPPEGPASRTPGKPARQEPHHGTNTGHLSLLMWVSRKGLVSPDLSQQG